jgi:hypothetical protein
MKLDWKKKKAIKKGFQTKQIALKKMRTKFDIKIN